MSANLSLTSLTDTTIMRAAGLDPRQMTLEITESAATSDAATALENLARLRMHGFGLSIDDYGTGYASMQQLMRIPFTELKVDQGFVTGCGPITLHVQSWRQAWPWRTAWASRALPRAWNAGGLGCAKNSGL